MAIRGGQNLIRHPHSQLATMEKGFATPPRRAHFIRRGEEPALPGVGYHPPVTADRAGSALPSAFACFRAASL